MQAVGDCVHSIRERLFLRIISIICGRKNIRMLKYPRLYFADMGGTKNQRESTYWLYDGSYFRLKNLTFGYTLPKALTQKAKIQRLRVYFSGDNLLTFTKFPQGGDPERNYNSTKGTRLVYYPPESYYLIWYKFGFLKNNIEYETYENIIYIIADRIFGCCAFFVRECSTHPPTTSPSESIFWQSKGDFGIRIGRMLQRHAGKDFVIWDFGLRWSHG